MTTMTFEPRPAADLGALLAAQRRARAGGESLTAPGRMRTPVQRDIVLPEEEGTFWALLQECGASWLGVAAPRPTPVPVVVVDPPTERLVIPEWDPPAPPPSSRWARFRAWLTAGAAALLIVAGTL